MMLASCGGDKKTEHKDTRIQGEWHLTLWNAAAPTEFDAYVAFAADNTFDIYQRIEQVGYQHFQGTYLLDGTRLSGQYSDRTPWGSTYEVSFDAEGNIMTMTSEASVGEISVYKRTEIPQSVKEDKWAALKLAAAAIFRLL